VTPSGLLSTSGRYVRRIGAVRLSVVGGAVLAFLSYLLVPSLVTVTGTVLYGVVFVCALYALSSVAVRFA